MITITDSAAQALLDLIKEKGEGDGLRLAVEKGGCAGLQYNITLATAQADDSISRHPLGAAIYVDPESVPYLSGSTLDYEDGLTGAGFRIINPKAARSCGCGTSFEPTNN